MIRKPEEESRLSKPYHKDRLEYWGESWRSEETCCPSDSSEWPPAMARNNSNNNHNSCNTRSVNISDLPTFPSPQIKRNANKIISEYRKFAQKEYKNRYDWVWKLIRWKPCKKIKFVHTTKWYMYKPEAVLEYEPLIQWNFEIQIDYPIPVTKTDVVLNSKKKKKNSSTSETLRSSKSLDLNLYSHKICLVNACNQKSRHRKYILQANTRITKGNPRGDVANVLDCSIIVSGFELQSCYCVH